MLAPRGFQAATVLLISSPTPTASLQLLVGSVRHFLGILLNLFPPLKIWVVNIHHKAFKLNAERTATDSSSYTEDVEKQSVSQRRGRSVIPAAV